MGCHPQGVERSRQEGGHLPGSGYGRIDFFVGDTQFVLMGIRRHEAHDMNRVVPLFDIICIIFTRSMK